jgi:transglutaminase-like putative cysteine protease
MKKALVFRRNLIIATIILFIGTFLLPSLEVESNENQSSGNILVYGTWYSGGGYNYTFYNDDLPNILQNHGYSVTVTDRALTPTITASLLAQYDQLWILNTKYSGSGSFSQTEINTILDFRAAGHGLLISGDNTDPGGGGFAYDVNQISVPLGVTFYGLADHGGPQITPVFETHPLFSGVTTIHGNNSEAFMLVNSPADVVATYQGDDIIAVSDDGLGRVVFDNTFVRFWDGASNILIGDNPQYTRNIADWLMGGGTTGGTISGTVTSTGTGTPPISGASIVLIERPEYSAKTNAQGQYTITRVPAGTYTVRASKSGYSSQQASAQVTSGQTTPKNFSLTPSSCVLILKSWGIDDVDGYGKVSPGDHGELRLTFRSIAGSGQNISVTLDASSTGGRIFFQNPSNPSQWLRNVTITIPSIIAGKEVTITDEIYFERLNTSEYPEGNIFPNNQSFTVTWPNGTKTISWIFRAVWFSRFSLSSPFPSGVTMVEEECLHHPFNSSILRYAQYAAANPDTLDSFYDPDIRDSVVSNVQQRVSSEFYKEEKRSNGRGTDTDLLKERFANLGWCNQFSDLSTGLLRSLGLQTRTMWIYLTKVPGYLIGGSHCFNEVKTKSANSQDSWMHYDALWESTGHKSLYSVYKPSVVLAEIVPLSNENTAWWRHDITCEGCPFCDPHDDLYECHLCWFWSFNPLFSTICQALSSQDVTPEYSGKEIIKWRTVSATEHSTMDSSVTLLLEGPIAVTRDSSFLLTVIVHNSGPNDLHDVIVGPSLTFWATDSSDIYGAIPHDFFIPILQSGVFDTLTYTITPLVGECIVPLLVCAYDSIGSFFQSSTLLQTINTSGTSPNTFLQSMVAPSQVEPSQAVNFHALVLSDSLKNVSDATVKVRIESETIAGYVDSTLLTYYAADSAYVGSLVLQPSAPVGDYRCFIECSKTGFDSDSQSTYFSVKPLLSLAVSTDDSVYDCREAINLSAVLKDRSDTVSEAILKANVCTTLGDYLIPMESDSTDVYHASFVPASLVPYFGDTTLPAGVWDLVVTTDYYGSAAADTARVRVKVPDLSVIAADIMFTPSEPDTGENVLISAKVRNIGDAASDSSIFCFYVDLLDSSAQVGADYDVPILQVNDSATISFMWNTEGLSETHTIYIQVDPDRISIDSRRSNNAASATVYIGSYIHGDVNGDGVIALGDVVYLITYLYKSGPAPNPLLAGDVNCDGGVALGDVVYLITYLYKGGPPPPC